jgi:hypothetical protein
MFKRKIILRQIYIYITRIIFIQWRIPGSKLHKIRKGAGLVVFNFFWEYFRCKRKMGHNSKLQNQHVLYKNRLLKMLACVTMLEIAIFNGRTNCGMYIVDE